MEYMGAREAAQKWGVKQSTVTRWCREHKIPGAEKDGYGTPWRIPANALCPKTKKADRKDQ